VVSVLSRSAKIGGLLSAKNAGVNAAASRGVHPVLIFTGFSTNGNQRIPSRVSVDRLDRSTSRVLKMDETPFSSPHPPFLRARKLSQYDGGKWIPAMVGAISDTVTWAEKLMDEINGRRVKRSKLKSRDCRA
jgi:hypothetical protein